MAGILAGLAALLLAAGLMFFPAIVVWELFAGGYLLSLFLAAVSGKKGFYLGLVAIIMNFMNALIFSPMVRASALDGIRLGHYRALLWYGAMLLLPLLALWLLWRGRIGGDRAG